ncbi:MAG: hypothetical protein HYZ23_02180 [Chloroflexi bacterium]|nr:hypothetical protein [Chloroflexota bacterium]
MKAFRWIHLLLILSFLAACGTGGTGGNPITNLFASPTPILPTAQATVIPAPDAQVAVNGFLQALQKDDFETMYAMLAKQSRDAITLEDFSKRWNNALNEMSAASIEYAINSSRISPTLAEIGYSVTYKTVLAGDIQRGIVMRLNNEENTWKVIWDDSLIMPELAGGNLLAMEYSVPARGDIYDRNGLPIVSQADAFAFGIQTDIINPEMRGALTSELGKLCGLDPEYINDQIDAAGPGW